MSEPSDQIAARDAIRSVIARQAQLRDDDRIDEWIEAWTEDGVFGAGEHAHRGRTAIRALADSLTTGTWRAVHLLSEPLIEVDGDTARASTDVVIIAAGRDGRLNVRAVNRYRDTFRREPDGAWRFTERIVEQKSPTRS